MTLVGTQRFLRPPSFPDPFGEKDANAKVLVTFAGFFIALLLLLEKYGLIP